MSPEAFVKPDQTYTNATRKPCGCDFPQSPECACDTSCAYCWPDFQNHREVTAWMRWEPIRNALIVLTVVAACVVGVAWLFTGISDARSSHAGMIESSHHAPEPIAIPANHATARAKCPTLLACRAALIHSLDAVSWQRSENLKLARQMVGNVDAWTCIHNGKGARYGTGEGSWTDTGDPYWGGLQMDRGFMQEYGRDMILRHNGGLADTWTPREQIIVAQRAFAQGRGYAPWPNTSRACGLR